MRSNPPPKHVLILVENLPVPFDRRPWQIAQSLVAAGHRVSVICPKMYEYTASHERLRGIDIYRYPNREGDTPIGWILEYANAMAWMFLIALRLFFTTGIDAIHACNPPDLLFLVAWPFKAFFGVRFLFDHHDLSPEVFLAKFGRKGLIYRVLCLLERLTYSLADVALATNESFKRLAVSRDRMNPDRIYVVRNAPQPGHLTPAAPDPALHAGKPHLVVYLGVMNKQDGLDLLLQSIRHLARDNNRHDIHWALIGDGPEVPKLKALAREWGVDADIEFTGRISDGKVLSRYINSADVCVCPDPRNEMNDRSTMTKVVEYMSLGKPIVAYDLAETIYSAADAAAFVGNNDPVRFGDLVADLLDHPDRRQAMGHAGRQRYDELLSWPRQQAILLQAYSRLFDPANAGVRS